MTDLQRPLTGGMVALPRERAVALVNLAAVERNCGRLLESLGAGARLCAVVKGDGYGHGAVPMARAALAGGASVLGLATAGEASHLRAEGIEAPLLLLGALTEAETRAALLADAEVVAWSEPFIRRLVDLVGEGIVARPVRVHVKLDSGMGRLGVRDPAEADRVADLVAGAPGLELVGAMTHFATADERGDAFFGEQLGRFRRWAEPLRARHRGITLHAANSAATLREPGSHFDMVRCGVAIYGLDPFGEDPARQDLEPALELRSYVAEAKICAPGESVGYGRTWIADRPTWVGVVPLGYGDGWRRALSNRSIVLVGGRPRPVIGTISMDNLTVDLGSDGESLRGAPAVLIGAAGREQITAEMVARELGTINYEVTCGLLPRVPRVHHHDGFAPAEADGVGS